MAGWFGPSKEAIWRQLAESIGGRFEGGFLRGDRVEATHGNWTVTLDSYTVSTGHTHVTYTRMRAPFVNAIGFRFTVYRKGLFSDVAKYFGMQDIELGIQAFDESFVIKGTDESLVRALLSHPRIRELIDAQPKIHFSVKDDSGGFARRFPEEVDVLTFLVSGTIKDLDRLKLLYDLFAETLDQLCKMGVASERAPDVDIM